MEGLGKSEALWPSRWPADPSPRGTCCAGEADQSLLGGTPGYKGLVKS